MKQRLNIPEGHEGTVWHYRPSARRHASHRHEELEVNLVVAGEAAYLVDGRRHLLQRGSMLWLFPAQDHLLLREGREFEMWIGVFRPRLAQRCAQNAGQPELAQQSPAGTFNRQVDRRACDRLVALCRDVVAARGRDDAALCNVILNHLLLAAWTAFQDAAAPPPLPRVHPAIAEAARRLQDQPQRGQTLEQLAAAVGLSPSRLSHLFSEQTGLSITAYRNRQRIERFLELTDADPRRDMLSTALAAGFGSYAQFHRVFKQVMGTGPRAWSRIEVGKP